MVANTIETKGKVVAQVGSPALLHVCFNVINIPISWKMDRKENVNELDGSNCFFFSFLFLFFFFQKISFEFTRWYHKSYLVSNRNQTVYFCSKDVRP